MPSYIMADICSYLMLGTLLYVILCCSYGTAAVPYGANGPMKCMEMCQDSAAFPGVIRGYHFMRLSAKDSVSSENVSSKESSFFCLDTDRMTIGKPSLAVVEGNKSRDGENKAIQRTTSGKHTDDLKVVKCQNSRDMTTACSSGKLDLVQQILSQNPEDINCRDNRGKTPVMIAVQWGQVEMVHFLLRQGCDLTAKDQSDYGALHYACMKGKTDIVKMLINEEKIDREMRGYWGRTPIMIAALSCHQSVVELLVKIRCNITVVDDTDNNILHMAAYGDCVQVANYILSNNMRNIEDGGQVGRTAVMTAAKKCNLKMVRFLVSKGCNLNAFDNDNNTILHWACRGGCIDIVRYVLSKGKTNIESRGVNGYTPVMTAAGFGNKDIVDLLRSKGCNLKTVDDYGNTILHMACWRGCVDMVRHLLRLRVGDVMKKNHKGLTPPQVAEQEHQKAIVDLFKSWFPLSRQDLHSG